MQSTEYNAGYFITSHIFWIVCCSDRYCVVIYCDVTLHDWLWRHVYTWLDSRRPGPNHLYIHVNKIYLIKEKCNESRYSLRHVVVYIWLLEVYKNTDRYVTRFNFLNTNYCFSNINSKIMGRIALQHSLTLIKISMVMVVLDNIILLEKKSFIKKEYTQIFKLKY